MRLEGYERSHFTAASQKSPSDCSSDGDQSELRERLKSLEAKCTANEEAKKVLQREKEALQKDLAAKEQENFVLEKSLTSIGNQSREQCACSV